jgi:hypothetical protein
VATLCGMNLFKRWARRVRVCVDAGMSTAEYAVGTVSACGFAGLLYQLLTSDLGRDLLSSILDKVLGLLPF